VERIISVSAVKTASERPEAALRDLPVQLTMSPDEVVEPVEYHVDTGPSMA
jgi:hypothetical protein